MVFTLRPSAHLPTLATRAGLGTISGSSGIVRFVQGGVVKTFRQTLVDEDFRPFRFFRTIEAFPDRRATSLGAQRRFWCVLHRRRQQLPVHRGTLQRRLGLHPLLSV